MGWKGVHQPCLGFPGLSKINNHRRRGLANKKTWPRGRHRSVSSRAIRHRWYNFWRIPGLAYETRHYGYMNHHCRSLPGNAILSKNASNKAHEIGLPKTNNSGDILNSIVLGIHYFVASLKAPAQYYYPSQPKWPLCLTLRITFVLSGLIHLLPTKLPSQFSSSKYLFSWKAGDIGPGPGSRRDISRARPSTTQILSLLTNEPEHVIFRVISLTSLFPWCQKLSSHWV